jgi:hypothetical protein
MAAEKDRSRVGGTSTGPRGLCACHLCSQQLLVGGLQRIVPAALGEAKASTARAFVPPELRLVEAFGYTLGGMFLARYHDSPAGEFDELVVIAGPPTSCA